MTDKPEIVEQPEEEGQPEEEKAPAPPLKCDVAINYYRQERFFKTLCWGLRENADVIGTIYICNDEPWERKVIDQLVEAWGGPVAQYFGDSEHLFNTENTDLPSIVLLEHPHEGFGPAKSFNQSISASDAEYVFTMTADQILPPDTLQTILLFAAPKRVIVGAVHHIAEEEFDYSDLPDKVRIKVPDWKPSMHQQMFSVHRQWMVCHNGHNLWHRESFLELGGFDESVCKYGRTSEDHELGARWMHAYGPTSIYFCPTFSWHFGNRHLPERAVETPTKEARELIGRTLGVLYEGRYYFFPDPKQPLWSHVMCVPPELSVPYVDARVDCCDVSWMTDESVNEIIMLAGHKHIDKDGFKLFASTIMPKMRPWGSVKIFLPEDMAYNSMFVRTELAAQGFEIDQHEVNVVTATKEGEDEEAEDTDAS